MTLSRRRFVLGTALVAVLAACKSSDKTQRCKHCGMKIDPASPWRVELVLSDGGTLVFDTPHCAFSSWRSGASKVLSIRAQEYYERTWRSGDELRFVLGSDVVGPMGADLVPVSPERVTKFIQDHSAERALRVEEVTADVLKQVK